LRWTGSGQRTLFPHVPSMLRGGEETTVFANGAGAWTLYAVENEVAGEALQTIRADSAQQMSIELLAEYGELLAVPAVENELRAGPYDVLTFTDDNRNIDTELNGEPVVRRRFAGGFAHAAWIPPGDDRALVLHASPMEKDLWLLVSVNGQHRGVWKMDAGDEPRLRRLPLDLDLEPGTHQIDVIGTDAAGSGADAFFDWYWGGISIERITENDRVASLERRTEVRLLTRGGGEAPVWRFAADQSLVNIFEPAPVYARDTMTLSGVPEDERVLRFAIGQGWDPDIVPSHPLHQAPVPKGDATHMLWTFWGRNNGAVSFGVQPMRLLVRGGNQAVIQPGRQQYLISPESWQWRRMADFVALGEDIQAAAPGAWVFPPNPERRARRGTLDITPLRLPGEEKPASPNLPESLQRAGELAAGL
jgi:hypothetical protein